MHAPEWLPQDVRDTGLVPDLQIAMEDVVRLSVRQTGTAVVYDMDHTEGVYAAVEKLADLFERVVLITPRALIAQDVSLVTRQGIVRRLTQRKVDVLTLTEPCWTERFEDGCLEYVNVYSGERGRDRERVVPGLCHAEGGRDRHGRRRSMKPVLNCIWWATAVSPEVCWAPLPTAMRPVTRWAPS